METTLFDKIHDLHNLLRNKEGIIGEKALYEINQCFTIRLLEPLLTKLKLPNLCKFSQLINLDEELMFESYKAICRELQKNKITDYFGYKNTNITRADTIRQLILTINFINIENEDIRGKIYEYFVGRDKDTISDLGQYFTSYKIIKYCIELIKPTITDSILDPTCGACGFLSNCALYINQHNENVDWSIIKNNFKGYDIAGDVVKIGLVNMLLATNELFIDFTTQSNNPCIERKDTFRTSINKKYDVILANPPYGGDKITKKGGKDKNIMKYDYACQEIKDFNVYSSIKELLFLQMIMQNLNDGGRACVVLPEGLFKNIQDKSFIETRRKLIEEFNVVEIGIVNNKEFDNTCVNVCILYFEKTINKTKNVIFRDIITKNIIIDVPYDNIINKNYSLSYKIHIALLCIKPLKNYNLVELQHIIKIFERSKKDANDGLLHGKYRFYTCSNGSFLYSNTNSFKQRSIILSRSCRAILNIDDNYDCSNSFHNIISKDINIQIEYIYYYLKQNSFILDMLFAGTILKNLSRTILGYINIHIPKDKSQLKIIKDLHDIIQTTKETTHNEIRQLEDSIDNLSIIVGCKTEPLYKPSEYNSVQNTTLMEKAHAIHNLLRNEEGIIGENALHEIQLVFLIRQLESKIEQLGLSVDFKFSNMVKLTDADILADTYRKVRTAIRNKFTKDFDIRDSKITNAETLYEFIKLVNTIDFNTNEDLKGKLYEYFIGRDKQNIKDLGQYFTNFKIVDYCIQLVKPGLTDKILDPTCGSCGFLTNCALYLNKHNKNIDWSIYKDNINGMDIALDICMTGRINLFLATNEIFNEKQITRKDTLSETINDQYDIILANPPYGGDNSKNKEFNINYKKISQSNTNIKFFNVETKCKELLFTQMLLTRIKPKTGRACIVLPEGLFFKNEKAFIETRKKMIEDFNVVEIGCATNAFENTSVNTCIVFIKNDGNKTSTVKFTDINTGNEIITVNYEEIRDNDYSLVYNCYIVKMIQPLKNYNTFILKDIIQFIPLKKNNAKIGMEEGLYRFYTCSVGTKLFTNNYDKCTEDRSIIIATGGSAKINIDEKYSASADNFAFKSKSQHVLIEWIYYYLKNNIHLIETIFLGTVLKHINQPYFCNICIHVPSMDEQQKVKQIYDNIYTLRVGADKIINKTEEQIKNLPVLKEVKLENPLKDYLTIDTEEIDNSEESKSELSEEQDIIIKKKITKPKPEINTADLEITQKKKITKPTSETNTADLEITTKKKITKPKSETNTADLEITQKKKITKPKSETNTADLEITQKKKITKPTSETNTVDLEITQKKKITKHNTADLEIITQKKIAKAKPEPETNIVNLEMTTKKKIIKSKSKD